MSKEQAKGFFGAISKDKQLAEEVKQVVGGRTSNEAKAKALFDLARGHGFNFSKNEAISLTRDELKASLQIESLSDVSGGAKGSIKPAVMAAFLLAGMGVSGAAMSNMEASAAPPKVQVEQRVDSYDVYTAEDFVNFFTREDYQGQATRGVTITLLSDISLTAEQARAVMDATNGHNPEPDNPYDRSFHGTLDGSGHSITLNFTEPVNGWFHGLFSYTDGATFRNLRVQFDCLTGASGVLVHYATDSTFDNVVVTGNLIELNLGEGMHNGWPYTVGVIADACLQDMSTFTNCVVQVGSINIHSERDNCPLSVGGCVGFSHGVKISGCAFSGSIDVSSTTSAVHVGGIVGGEPAISGDIKVDNCVVSNSQIKATTNAECAAGAITGCCRSESVVRNSAALNCSVNAPGNYTGQIVGASVPYLGHGPHDIQEAFDDAEPNDPAPQIYGCFHTNEGPAVGREREQNLTAVVQADQDTIMSAHPNLVPVLERLQNPQWQQTDLNDIGPAGQDTSIDALQDLTLDIGQQLDEVPTLNATIQVEEENENSNSDPAIEQQEQQTGLVSSALKWVGSWFGLGGKK